MAYNVLKGKVEGSVDQYADQEISGVKVFKNTISASVFYDTNAGEPCITAQDLPIKKLQKESPGGIVVYKGNQNAETNHDLRYQGKTLYASHVCSVFEGDGKRLKNLPVDCFNEKIPSTSLKLGFGLESMRGALQVRAGSGLFLDDEGVGIGLAPNSGLAFKNNRLLLDIKSCESITKNGQNLSDSDTLFVYDASLNQMRTSTLDNFCTRYISEKLPRPTGDLGSLQMKGRAGFISSNDLIYDDGQKTLIVDGTVKSRKMKNTHGVELLGPLKSHGQICNAIKHVQESRYEIEDGDYTLLLDSGKKNMEVILPPPSNNNGRIIILKKVNQDKYKLNSGIVKISSPEGKIDISNEIVIKMNYSLRMLQSDGKNWWIIGSKGS